MKTYHIFGIGILMLLLVACGGSQPNPADTQKVAQVGDKILYKSDIQGIGQGLAPEDSSAQVKIFAQNWVTSQLLYTKAAETAQETPALKAQVEAYRQSLLLAAYYDQLLKESGDTNLSASQIADYYNKHSSEFKSPHEWVRCYFIRVPSSYQGVDDLEDWFKSDSRSNKDKIAKFCTQNKPTFLLDEQKWVRLDAITSKLPEGLFSEKYLDGAVLHKEVDDYLYLVQVFEYKPVGKALPLSEVSEEIKRIVLEVRKKKLRIEAETELLKNAKYEIF
jgi:hypothetical protein